ncbi:TIGR02217 family protein [Meinhardsimonia xiamenensis]|jgi:uncharacterized protein (TIGR02217 family)|uniref:TIGR02217 family protein n=1 Tax=Meinhardsimonia xiamenensis TaxID=990712 RepID=A0A1G9AID5_9RHOB|nr:DUF2460 domain-containing protein [Meinhardsimonia xiamenensis]PRX35385.1 uncharacterized protein (TIGR02217 family) [Meinhardsimonia xiamenensis]SDK26584.1 TIGR02217 family protein [Meinhardsimonia xiamenensis]
MAFHEVRFPAALSFGATGGPERRTEVVTLANGFEERNSLWAHSRRRYDAGLALSSLDDLETVLQFFEARRGRLHAFRWKDWADFKSCAPSREVGPFDQQLGTGDEVTTAFQLVKLYRSGDETADYRRPIVKPVAGTVRVAVGGVELVEGEHFTVDHAQGVVSLGSAPAIGAVVTAGFEFDVPVRFDTDRIDVSVATFQAGEVPSIPVVEVRI